MPGEALLKVKRLCDAMVKAREPKMRWMWGEALFGYALSELDDYLGTQTYTPFLTAFCDYYAAHPPRVDCSDTCAPALITYAMEKKTNNPACGRLTQRAVEYIRSEPRILGEAVNHLGHSPEGRFYPKSIWVDSLMMFSVFPARYAAERGDQELKNYAARQPGLYSQYLQDKKTGLWSHSYWVKAGHPQPKMGVFWGRGNGWVMAALPMILDQIGPDHPQAQQIEEIFTRTARAVLNCQRPDGSFSTVLGSRLYRELSATALIGAGMLHGVRRGYLNQSFLIPGARAFEAVEKSIMEKGGDVLLPEISAPTIPLHVFPYLGYKFTPRGSNYPYGVAAAVFAALEYDRLRRFL